MQSYLLSWLTKRYSSAGLDAFVAERPEAWLVWEAGPWRPTYRNRDTMVSDAPNGQAPVGTGESLAIVIAGDPRKGYVTLGRGTDNDIVIDDATLSRLHLLFQQDGSGWTVRDAGSSNGSAVDGARLGPDAVALSSGTPIDAGAVRLTFYDSAGLYLRLKGAA